MKGTQVYRIQLFEWKPLRLDSGHGIRRTSSGYCAGHLVEWRRNRVSTL